jgi:hypothetical protein
MISVSNLSYHLSMYYNNKGNFQHQILEHLLNKGSVTHTMALPFTFKSILRQKKKNYENSNIISPCKKIYLIFKKNPLKETKIL